jgi:hypothetical protein
LDQTLTFDSAALANNIDDYVSITNLNLTIGALDNTMYGDYNINLLVEYHNCSNSNSNLNFMLTVVCDLNEGPLVLSSTTDTDFDYNFFEDTTINTNFTFSHHVCGTPTI